MPEMSDTCREYCFAYYAKSNASIFRMALCDGDAVPRRAPARPSSARRAPPKIASKVGYGSGRPCLPPPRHQSSTF